MSISARLLDLPDLVALLLVLLAVALPAAAGLALVNRFHPPHRREGWKEIAGFIYAVVGVIYGVLLAFVVIVIWEQFSDAKSDAGAESSIAQTIWHEAGIWPDRTASVALQAAIVAAARRVVEDEYPAMGRGERSESTHLAMNAVWGVVGALRATDDHSAVLLGQILQDIDEWNRSRARRIEASREELPGAVWLVLVIGAAITIGFSFLFGLENARAQHLMTALLALLIAMTFFIIIELDHPFRGSVSIEPEGYRFLIDALAREG